MDVDHTLDRKGAPPRWMIVTAFGTVIAIITIVLTAYYLSAKNCQEAAVQRHDHRVIWEILIQQNPGAEADEFRDEVLDVFLPALTCEGTNLREL